MTKYTSYGTCALCGKRTTKAGMTRHLESCLAEHEPTSGAKAARLFRLRVEDTYSPVYWMDVEIRANSPLATLDDFLRRTWLECCGHLSSFFVGPTEYTVPIETEDIFGVKVEAMNVRLDKVLSEGTRFRHLYDFGTSTELKLRVTGERLGRIGSEPLRLLSRNEAPEWECEVCGAPATQVCTICMWERDNPFYCGAHAENHDCEDPDMLLPVVNSPRMGQCGYTGPLHLAS